MICPGCQKDNRPGLLLCEYCGHQLLSASESSRFHTRRFDSPTADSISAINRQKLGTGYLHQSSFVTLDLIDANRQIFQKTVGHILLGRADQEAQWQPTIDLTPYGAREKGVSRVHVDLFFESDQVFVLELGSANGTRVNGRNIEAGHAHQIFNGDLLELGKFRLRVYFT